MSPVSNFSSIYFCNKIILTFFFNSWTYGFVPSRKYLIRHLLTKVSLSGWNWMHLIICCIGISTFFTYTSTVLSTWIIVIIICSFFALWCLVKWCFGTIHIYKSLGGVTEDSSLMARCYTGIGVGIFNILLFITSFMGPSKFSSFHLNFQSTVNH